MSTSRKSRVIGTFLCATLFVVLAIATAFFFWSARMRVTVFDSRFNVLGVRVQRSPADKLCLGNQMEGFLREFLHDRCRLNVKTVPALRKPETPAGCSLALQYSSKGKEGPGLVLETELVDPSGATFSLGDLRFGRNPYYALIYLDSERTNGGNYTLKLKWEGVCFAQAKLKNLPPVVHKPFRIGPNAF